MEGARQGVAEGVSLSAGDRDAASARPTVRAAGGVVLRDGADGTRETLLVHRPAYDDWTLPKGKADPGESDEACALREVEEETGVRCALGRELAPAEYVDGRGRDKRVRYWTMTPLPGEDGARFVANAEIDELRWLPLAAAARLLTYAHDRRLLVEVAGGAAGSPAEGAPGTAP